MKKVVRWDAPKITSGVNAGGKPRRIFKVEFAKALEREKEQIEALDQLQRAMPVMIALLEFKLKKGEPLMVMRPLQYQTSDLAKNDDDDGFYNTSKNQNPTEKFVDVVRTIYPGTKLMLKSLDPTMQEFVFVDGRNKEHSISYADRDKLLTQTDIYEETKKFMAHKENEK